LEAVVAPGLDEEDQSLLAKLELIKLKVIDTITPYLQSTLVKACLSHNSQAKKTFYFFLKFGLRATHIVLAIKGAEQRRRLFRFCDP
jgi:hypothetical protein